MDIWLSFCWCRGGHGCYFQPNPRVISQMSASHECTDTVFMTQKCIFLSVRLKLLLSVHYETPCTTGHHPKIFTTFLQNSQSGQKVALFCCQQYETRMEDKWKTSKFFFQSRICASRYFFQGQISFPETDITQWSQLFQFPTF